MCWFYMRIAQIALDPPHLCQTGKRGKKVPQTILAMPIYGNNTFQKGAFLKAKFATPTCKKAHGPANYDTVHLHD